MKVMEQNKEIKENEASILRWFATILVGLLVGALFAAMLYVLQFLLFKAPAFREGGSLSIYTDFIKLLIPFAGLYWGSVFAIKKVAKTTMKSFILGADRDSRLNVKKEALPIAGLYLLGLFLTSVLPNIKNIAYSGISLKAFLFILVFSLIFTWMQTSWEEILYRGIPLRILCKNNISFSLRTFLFSLIPSALFMLGHFFNPEVQQFSGVQKILLLLCYFVPSIAFILCNMLSKNLVPCLVIHWINNFLSFVVLSTEVSASGGSSLFIDYSKISGAWVLIMEILAFVPVILYLFLKNRKKIVAE